MTHPVWLRLARDYAKARDWYEKAAEKDHTSAKAQLEQLLLPQVPSGS